MVLVVEEEMAAVAVIAAVIVEVTDAVKVSPAIALGRSTGEWLLTATWARGSRLDSVSCSREPLRSFFLDFPELGLRRFALLRASSLETASGLVCSILVRCSSKGEYTHTVLN